MTNKKEQAQKPQKIICQKCNVEMHEERTGFAYLGRTFHTEVLKCPKCKMVYIPEDLVKGRMHEVETLMEDK